MDEWVVSCMNPLKFCIELVDYIQLVYVEENHSSSHILKEVNSPQKSEDLMVLAVAWRAKGTHSLWYH